MYLIPEKYPIERYVIKITASFFSTALIVIASQIK